MKRTNFIIFIALLIALLRMSSFAQDTTSVEPKVLRDGVGAKSVRVENMHQVRYVEMFLMFRDAKTGSLVAASYNPMFAAKDLSATKDTAPQDLIEGLDYAKIPADFGVLGASLNGPKLWQPDWAEADVGVVRDFNGIKAAWIGQTDMSKGGVGDGTPYQPVTTARKGKIGWNTGTTVLLIDDAEGNTWVMRGFELGVAPKYTYDRFVAAAETYFKELPAGWKFRVVKLTRDLIESPEGGLATSMSDEFYNVYDKTGPGMTNYKP